MEEEKVDPIFAAVQVVHNALRPLNPPDRSRVISSVAAILELGPIPSVPGPAIPGQPQQDQRPVITRPVSLIELIKDKHPGSNAERIALFAYYRDKYEAKLRFARDDLRAYFPLAKIQPPANYDRDFVEAVREGWLHEDAAESYITSKGVEAVEGGFPGAAKAPQKKKPRKAGKGKRAS